MLPPFDMLAESDIEKFRRDTFWTKEPETIAWIDSFADGDVFFDVGANVGVYSLYCAAVHPRCSIYAFEPCWPNFEHLKANVALNGFHRVTAAQVAVTDHDGVGVFNDASAMFGATGGQIDNLLCNGMPAYHVNARTIDTLAQFHGCPQHIKIDIDGQELKVFRGMRVTIATPALRSVLIEFDLTQPVERSAIIPSMRAAGFTTDNPFNRMTPHSRERRAKEGIHVENVIFTRGWPQ